MDDAGGIDENIDLSHLRHQGLDGGFIKHVELGRDDPALALDLLEHNLVDVGRRDPGAGIGESQRGGAADTLRGGGDQD